MITITERDKDFLLALNETGACNSKLPLIFYPKRYSRNKLEKMKKEKIIIRKYDLITLGIKGKTYLESIGVLPIVVATKPIPAQKRLARATELRYLLPSMEIFTSAQYKKEKNLNRGMQFVAAATTSDRIDYLIYDVPKMLTCEAKTQILRELKNKKGVINRVIILTQNKDFVQTISNSNIFVNELLLIPPKDCFINLLNVMGTGGFDRKVIGSAFPELLNNKTFDKKQTQYIVKDNTYINLVLNNLSALDMLSSLDMHITKTNMTWNQIYNIVCLDSQKSFFKDKILKLKLKRLNVQIATVTVEELLP